MCVGERETHAHWSGGGGDSNWRRRRRSVPKWKAKEPERMCRFSNESYMLMMTRSVGGMGTMNRHPLVQNIIFMMSSGAWKVQAIMHLTHTNGVVVVIFIIHFDGNIDSRQKKWRKRTSCGTEYSIFIYIGCRRRSIEIGFYRLVYSDVGRSRVFFSGSTSTSNEPNLTLMNTTTSYNILSHRFDVFIPSFAHDTALERIYSMNEHTHFRRCEWFR